jgi:hypothetical protein
MIFNYIAVTPIKIELSIAKLENQTKIDITVAIDTSLYLISPFQILLTVVIVAGITVGISFLLIHLRMY